MLSDLEKELLGILRKKNCSFLEECDDVEYVPQGGCAQYGDCSIFNEYLIGMVHNRLNEYVERLTRDGGLPYE